MGRQSITSRSERAAVLTVAVVAHLALFALLFTIGSDPPLADPQAGTMSLIAIAPEVAQGKPPPPVLPSKIAGIKRIVSRDDFSAELDPTPFAATGGCGTLELVMKSLLAEPIVVAGVVSTPPERRSIAGAVVIWNAGWSDTASAPGEPLGPARVVIEQKLRSVPDTCLDEPVTGPRLVPIPEGERTMFLAIGSGIWTWRQLLTDSDPTWQDGVEVEDQSAKSFWDWF